MTTSALASPQVSGVSESSVTVTEQLDVTPVSPLVTELSAKPATAWTAADFRGFVFAETTRLNGPQLPVQQSDEILTGFFDRFGVKAVEIARRVFEVHGGMWMSAPVTVRRFAERQDGFFADPILAEMAQE